MRVEWHGQSAFTLTGSETKVFIDPFGEMGSLLADRGPVFTSASSTKGVAPLWSYCRA